MGLTDLFRKKDSATNTIFTKSAQIEHSFPLTMKAFLLKY